MVGRSGRDAVVRYLPELRRKLDLDFVAVNGDNAAAGFGISPAICRDFLAAGADVVTGGDHIWDQKDIVGFIEGEKRLLRPQNFPERTPGRGFGTYPARGGGQVSVLHLLGQVFHKEHAACPFAAADNWLKDVRLTPQSVLIVDFHAEATSEKMAMGQHLDGRVSMVVGSHTHVPTQDARVLKKGTAYQTDAGMCGDYDSVIGFSPAAPLERFLTKIPKARLEPAAGEGTLCGLLVETGPGGLALCAEAVQYPAPLTAGMRQW